MDRRCVRFSLACWRCEAREESPELPLSADMLPSKVPALGDRGAWVGVGGTINVAFKVTGTMDWSRIWGSDGGGTVSGSDVDEEMSAAKDETGVGGALPSSDVIIWGWGDWSRPEAAGATSSGWLPYLSIVMYWRCLYAVQLARCSSWDFTCWREESKLKISKKG